MVVDIYLVRECSSRVSGGRSAVHEGAGILPLRPLYPLTVVGHIYM